MKLQRLNVMLAQFLFLAATCGLILYGILLNLFNRLGFAEKGAEIAAVVLTLCLIAATVVLRWSLMKPPAVDVARNSTSSGMGHTFVAIGNATMLLGVIPITVGSGLQGDKYAVVGGMAVLIGGAIAGLSWLLGAALMESSRPQDKDKEPGSH